MRSERKVVTVMFADIKGSIDLVARHDPEQAGEVLGLVVAQMGDAVRQFGGVVNQVMGDGIMALFGAPFALEDHAAEACAAALAMRTAIAEKVRPRVEVRVGLSSGEVVVRAVPGDVGLHYSAAGEPVHMASRMEQVAGPDQVVLTAATLGLAGGRAEVNALGQIQVKGLDETVAAFELLRVLPSRSRRAPQKPGFVGREREMQQLQQALDDAVSGEAQAVRVIAEAGCGKSRLVNEFTTERLPEGWALSRAEAVAHRRTSYAVVGELLGAVFGLEPEDGPELRREKVLAGLGLPEERAEQELLTPLSALLGLAPPADWNRLEARERRERTVAAASRSIQHASVRRPAAVVVEDAHWLDPESADVVQRLGLAVPGQRMLAIATERPPDTPFTDPRHWKQCQMSSLDERGTHALLDSLLLPGPEVPALERKLIEHTQGNPLFIEECLQSLVDTGELVRDGDRFRLERPVAVLRVPDSLRGLLDARVDRLIDVHKDVLQAASVVGTTVPAELLRMVVPLGADELDGVLDRLCAGGFLVQAGSAEAPAAPRYAFRHGLIREAAYNGILLRSRVRMHGAVLEALERLGRGEAESDLLADHATQAEAWPKAIAYSRTAASRAEGRYANPEAARFYKQALHAASRSPDSEEKERTQLALHIALREPLFKLGHVHALRPHLEEAAELAGRHGNHERLGHSHALRSHVLWLSGEPDAAESAAEEVRRIARRHEDRDLAVRAQFQSALVHLAGSRIPAIIAALREVLDHLGQSPPRAGRYGLDAGLAVTSLSYLARANAAAGAFGEARRALDEAIRYSESSGLRQHWIWVHTAAGVVLTAEGKPHEAVDDLEKAYEACVNADMRLLRPVAAGFLALAYAESGRAETGVARAREAVEEAERMGFLALHPMRLAILAQAELMRGDHEAAANAATRARDLAIRIKEPGAEAYATGLLGEVARRCGEEDRAPILFRTALAQAEELGLAPLAACLRQRLEDPANRAHPWLDGIALAP